MSIAMFGDYGPEEDEVCLLAEAYSLALSQLKDRFIVDRVTARKLHRSILKAFKFVEPSTRQVEAPEVARLALQRFFLLVSGSSKPACE